MVQGTHRLGYKVYFKILPHYLFAFWIPIIFFDHSIIIHLSISRPLGIMGTLMSYIWYEMHSEVAPVYITCILQWTGVLLSFSRSAWHRLQAMQQATLRIVEFYDQQSTQPAALACKSLQLFMCRSHSRGIHSTGEICWLNTC
jgi:hypothetical protein